MFGARILLVEDDELLRDVVCRNLQVRHHEVHSAINAHSALVSLRTMSFMEGKNMPEMPRLLRHNHRKPLRLALTAHSSMLNHIHISRATLISFLKQRKRLATSTKKLQLV